ncbi:MAG: hypothetical protein ACRD44_01525, partial [Bryobacteraceae bacterium]
LNSANNRFIRRITDCDQKSIPSPMREKRSSFNGKSHCAAGVVPQGHAGPVLLLGDYFRVLGQQRQYQEKNQNDAA